MPINFALGPNAIQSLNGAPGFTTALQRGTWQVQLLKGRNPAASTSLGDIWGYPSTSGGAAQLVRNVNTAAYTLAVVSDSAVDINTSGTGAWTVAVNYLDSNYIGWNAIFALNGLTAVTVPLSITNAQNPSVTLPAAAINNCLRINGTEVITAGTGLANAGNIYVYDNSSTLTSGVPQTASKVYDCILVGDNIDSTSNYTIPAGYTGMLLLLMPTINDATTTQKFGKVRVSMTTGANGIFRSFDFGGLSNSAGPTAPDLWAFPILTAQSDLRIQSILGAATEMACINLVVIWPNL